MQFSCIHMIIINILCELTQLTESCKIIKSTMENKIFLLLLSVDKQSLVLNFIISTY